MSLIFNLVLCVNLQSVGIDELVLSWKSYLSDKSWEQLTNDVKPITDSCGYIYELPNFLGRPDEGFAIAYMKKNSVAYPHYHPEGVVEVYFVLEGSALFVIKEKEYHIKKGDSIVIPAMHAHFTIPSEDFVVGVVITPPYDPANQITLKESNPNVGFDLDKFQQYLSKIG